MTEKGHAAALAPFVRILGRGPGRSRSLTRAEASAAMELMLKGEAAPEAVGALLMLMRYRHESPEELAGFVDAARASLPAWRTPEADLDWPSYAAGKSRGLPYFLVSALLLAANGVRVAMHGYNSHAATGAGTRAALGALGIEPAWTPATARSHLASANFTYVPLDALSPPLLGLLKLRTVLGLRSPVNTTLRLLNPWRAPAAIQGVFHPPYIRLQIEAGRLLGQPRAAVFKGGGGEAERNPLKALAVEGLAGAETVSDSWPPLIPGAHRRLHEEEEIDVAKLVRLWRGEREDRHAEAIVVGTAAVAIKTVGRADSLDDATELARKWWEKRDLPATSLRNRVTT
jgi:anthranilate phosphoribosyltransferase